MGLEVGEEQFPTVVAFAFDLEKVAESTGTPVKKRVEEEEDEVVDVDALKAENDVLKAKLAKIGEAAAAIDA